MIPTEVIRKIIFMVIILVIVLTVLVYSGWLDPLLSSLIANLEPFKSVFM